MAREETFDPVEFVDLKYAARAKHFLSEHSIKKLVTGYVYGVMNYVSDINAPTFAMFVCSQIVRVNKGKKNEYIVASFVIPQADVFEKIGFYARAPFVIFGKESAFEILLTPTGRFQNVFDCRSVASWKHLDLINLCLLRDSLDKTLMSVATPHEPAPTKKRKK